MDSPLQADITTVGVDPCINPEHKELYALLFPWLLEEKIDEKSGIFEKLLFL